MYAGFEVVLIEKNKRASNPLVFLYGNPLACGMFVLSRRLQYKGERIPTQDAGFADATANRAAILGNKLKLGFAAQGSVSHSGAKSNSSPACKLAFILIVVSAKQLNRTQ